MAAAHLCRSAPPLHRGHQHEVPLDGPSHPGPLRRGGAGRPGPLGGGALHHAHNPVVARLVRHAEDWPWSSVRAHLAGEDDELATVAPLRALIPDFGALLTAPADPVTTTRIERAPTIGRPLGAPEWIAALERWLGRALALAKPGSKPRADEDTTRKPWLL